MRAPTQSALPRRVQHQEVQRASVQDERRSRLLVTQYRSRQRKNGLLHRVHVRVRPRCFLNAECGESRTSCSRTQSGTYPTAENFERIHCLFVPRPILADIVRSVVRICRKRVQRPSHSRARSLRPITLHVPHFLVELKVVTLEGTNVCPEVCYDLVLFSQLLLSRDVVKTVVEVVELNVLVTSSSSAFRCLNLSR